MNAKTLDYLMKAKGEFFHAKTMIDYCHAGSGNWNPLQYNHWKREAVELSKEIRAIETGKLEY